MLRTSTHRTTALRRRSSTDSYYWKMIKNFFAQAIFSSTSDFFDPSLSDVFGRYFPVNQYHPFSLTPHWLGSSSHFILIVIASYSDFPDAGLGLDYDYDEGFTLNGICDSFCQVMYDEHIFIWKFFFRRRELKQPSLKIMFASLRPSLVVSWFLAERQEIIDALLGKSSPPKKTLAKP